MTTAKIIKTLSANQNIIKTTDNTTKTEVYIFQSYNSIICVISRKDCTITFGHDYDYSNTTMKYLKSFLEYMGFSKIAGVAKVRKAIESGKCDNYNIIYDNNLI